MSHTVDIKLIADQMVKAEVKGHLMLVNVHDIEAITVSPKCVLNGVQLRNCEHTHYTFDILNEQYAKQIVPSDIQIVMRCEDCGAVSYPIRVSNCLFRWEQPTSSTSGGSA